MLKELKKAKEFIFFEYFIIKPGKMWDSILEILKEKASKGLDVRVMYDDLRCVGSLNFNYYKELKKYPVEWDVVPKSWIHEIFNEIQFVIKKTEDGTIISEKERR